MKNLKKDNKGFSLVELIVVVLIMAIIAVALAPQILKWVNNSRISSDNNTMQQLIANAQNALTNETVYGKVKARTSGSPVTITVENTTASVTNDTDGTPTFKTKFYEYCGVSNDTDFQKNFKTKQSGAKIVITVANGTGTVTGEITGGAASIDN